MKSTIITVIITILISTVGIMGFLLWQNKQQNNNSICGDINGIEDYDSISQRNVSYRSNGKNENNNKKNVSNDMSISIKPETDSQEDILSAINKAGYKMLPSNYDGSSYDINKRNNIFLLTRGNELFMYNKSNGNVVKVNNLSIPDGWDVIVRRSVTAPNDFVVSFILKEKLTNSGMFEYKIVDTKSYLINDSGAIKQIAKKLSDSINDFFSCEVLDSYNKRFLTWYCGEGLGSVAPVVAVDYNGKKIHSVLDDDPYFSHRGDENGYVVNIKVDMHNPNQLTANKYNNNNNNFSQKIFYIKENLIK